MLYRERYIIFFFILVYIPRTCGRLLVFFPFIFLSTPRNNLHKTLLGPTPSPITLLFHPSTWLYLHRLLSIYSNYLDLFSLIFPIIFVTHKLSFIYSFPILSILVISHIRLRFSAPHPSFTRNFHFYLLFFLLITQRADPLQRYITNSSITHRGFSRVIVKLLKTI